jgi:hypothetical protein
LLAQDEAFVIGFTMGRAASCPRWQASLFRWCAEHLYGKVYRFSPLDGEVFAFAFGAARQRPGCPLDRFDFRVWLNRPLGELRAVLGIEPSWLRALYREEVAHWPNTIASCRLALVSREAEPNPACAIRRVDEWAEPGERGSHGRQI